MEILLEDVVHMVSSGNHTDIDVWDKLVCFFSQQLDGHRDVFEEIKMLSGEKLGTMASLITDTKSYFTALENNFSDRNDLLDFLINVMACTKYHVREGSENVEEHLRILRGNLKKFRESCIRKGIFKDQNFVGRENEIKAMKNEINAGHRKGFLLCGAGGMGKTSLASAVCYELVSTKWRTTKIELRERRTFKEFLLATIHSIKDIVVSNLHSNKSSENEDEKEETKDKMLEETVLEHELKQYIINKMNMKRIYLFDNMEDVIAEAIDKMKTITFLLSLLQTLENRPDNKVRIIITSQNNFLMTSIEDLTETEPLRNRLQQLMVLIEVKPFDIEVGLQLVEKCTKRNIEKTLIPSCGGCPLALRMMCDLIVNDGIVGDLKQITGRALHIFDIYECFTKSYQSLNKHRAIICQLSLFGTAKFDLKSASNVVTWRTKNNDGHLEELKLILLLFKSRHLIEIDNYADGDLCCSETEPKMYSLHPLIYEYLRKRIMDDEFPHEIQEAKHNFLVYFDDLVIQIGKEYDKNALTARGKSEKMRVQIEKYFQFLVEIGFSELSTWQTETSIENVKRRNNVVQMVRSPDHHLCFLDSMVVKSAKETITLAKCCWDLEYLSAKINYDRVSGYEALTECKHLEAKINSFSEENNKTLERDQYLILRGRILYYMGLNATDPLESENFFEKARRHFESKDIRSKFESKLYLANVYNGLGFLKYQTREVENILYAMKMHKRAIELLDENCEINENIVLFHANIAACHFRLGLIYKHNDNEKYETEMKKAVECYNEILKKAVAIGMNKTYLYAKQLRKRADTLAILKNFKDAEKDYDQCLKTVRLLFAPPSEKEILILHAKGEMVRRWIFNINVGLLGQTERIEVEALVAKGLIVYETIQNIMNMKPDVFPNDHHQFQKVQQNHLLFVKRGESERLEEVTRWYLAYHARDSTMSPDSYLASDSRSECSNESEVEQQIEPNSDSICNNKNEQDVSGFVDKESKSITQNKQRDDRKNDIAFQDSPDIWSGNKNVKTTTLALDYLPTRNRANSSSGISSMEDASPLYDRSSSYSYKRRLSSCQGSSIEDDVFQYDIEHQNTHRPILRLGKRKVTSASSSDEMSIDMSQLGVSEKKAKTINDNVEVHRKTVQQLMRISPENNGISHLCRAEIGCQTAKQNLDNVIEELKDIEPFTQPMVRTLIKEIETGNAQVIGDHKGRPIVQYQED